MNAAEPCTEPKPVDSNQPTHPTTVTPPAELAEVLPPLRNYWFPGPLGWEMDEAENQAVNRFFRYLPVSPHLDRWDLTFLWLYVSPLFVDCTAEPCVHAVQIKELFDQRLKKYGKTATIPMVIGGLDRCFRQFPVVVIGQLELERLALDRLQIRLNVLNYDRMLDFLIDLAARRAFLR